MYKILKKISFCIIIIPTVVIASPFIALIAFMINKNYEGFKKEFLMLIKFFYEDMR